MPPEPRKTTVVNKHRLRGDTLGPNQVYIGRPSKWCNPASHLQSSFAVVRVATRQAAIAYFIEYLRKRPDLVEAARRELRGKELVCFCDPLPCHGHVLARVADGGSP